mmetsp:Transcript_107227/g.149473  ORF Transcript_107227/g.149473 Transcript_107227/m.149473 type:complete len:228 (+) Transcript_107227:61-744(+)
MTSVEIFLETNGSCSKATNTFARDWSLHLDGVLSREEFEWGLSKLDLVVKRHGFKIKYLLIFILACCLPWIIYVLPPVLDADPLIYTWLWLVPLAVQMAAMVWFIAKSRKERIALRDGLRAECGLINAHFAGRGVNWIAKCSMTTRSNNNDANNLGTYLVIEIAPRLGMQHVATPLEHAPVVPQGAIMMQQMPQMPQVAPPPYAATVPAPAVYYPEMNVEGAPLLRK